jgi:hypothetical protein
MGTAEPRPSLSVVVPVYNEEGPLHAEPSAVARQIGRPYEIVFVNDGSTDQTLPRLVALTKTDPSLRVVELDGNFGEAPALSAGFEGRRLDVPLDAEPLRLAAGHFVASIFEGTEPLTSGARSLRVVETLETADRTARRSGRLA